MKTKIEKINLTIIILLVVGLLIMINYISFRHYKRWDTTSSKIYSLSEKSKKVVNKLETDLHIILIEPNTDNSYELGSQIFNFTKELIKQYKSQSDKIKVEFINPLKQTIRINRLAKKYNLTSADVVIFEYNGRNKIVHFNDMIDIGTNPQNPRYQQTAEIESFKGESLFTSAILNLLEKKKFTVYFTSGHGEPDIKNNKSDGYSYAKTVLENNNYNVKQIQLIRLKSIPADCDILITAGPEYDFTKYETDLIKNYIESDTKANFLLMLNAPLTQKGLGTDFENLIELSKNYNINYNSDLILSTNPIIGNMLVNEPTFIGITNYSLHRITKSLNKKEIPTIFQLARSITPVNVYDTQYRTIKLFSATGDVWGEKDLSDLKNVEFDKEKDNKPPLLCGALVEYKKNNLIFLSNANFLTNHLIGNLGNSALFLSIIDYFAGKFDLISIPPKKPKAVQLTLMPGQLNFILIFCIVIMPLIAVLVGLIVWRKRKV